MTNNKLAAILIVSLILLGIVLFMRRADSQVSNNFLPRTEVKSFAYDGRKITVVAEIYGWMQQGDAYTIAKTGEFKTVYAARGESIVVESTTRAKYVPAKPEQWIWE